MSRDECVTRGTAQFLREAVAIAHARGKKVGGTCRPATRQLRVLGRHADVAA